MCEVERLRVSQRGFGVLSDAQACRAQSKGKVPKRESKQLCRTHQSLGDTVEGKACLSPRKEGAQLMGGERREGL